MSVRTVLPSEMKALESDFMARRGIPSLLLMERAAAGVADAIARNTQAGASVLFLCGCGNNGGDGLAAARLWRGRKGGALVWLMPGRLSPDAEIQRQLAEEAGVEIRVLREIPDSLPQCSLAVDALFGTGLSRGVTGPAAELIALLDRSGVPVLAVDIPSGLDGATGRVNGAAVRAVETVTFHRAKPGLFLRQGCAYAGRITVCPILIPADTPPDEGLAFLTSEEAAALVPPRGPESHKGTFGTAVLCVGSVGMAGAAALCAEACIRAGSGLTRILCPEAIVPVLQTLVPGATCIPLPGDASLWPGIAEKALRGAVRAAIGCGLGQDEDLLPLLRAFRAASCPVVWDAEALGLLASHPDLLPLPAKDFVTPHPGEAARLLSCTTAEVTDEPLRSLAALRERCGCNVILKGARSLMTDGTDCAVNPIGTPALAMGGSGDILTGLLCGLIGQGIPTSLQTMQLACYEHVLAAERAAKAHGLTSPVPQEIAASIRLG